MSPLFCDLVDPCDPVELVCLVSAHEAPRRRQSALSLPQQDPTEQPDQHGPQRQQLRLPVYQRPHALRRRPRPGEHPLLHGRHLSRFRGPLRAADRTSRRGRVAPTVESEPQHGIHGAGAGQDPGRGAVHRQKVS